MTRNLATRASRLFAVAALAGTGLVSTSHSHAQTLYGINGSGGANIGALTQIDQTNGSGTVIGTPVPLVGMTGLAFSFGGSLYATTQNDGFGSVLVQVDHTTGALVSANGVVTYGINPIGIRDLTMHPGTDILYGVNSDALYTIDPTTAAATLIGGYVTHPWSIAFDEFGTLWMSATLNGVHSLHTIDPATGAILTSVEVSQPYEGLGVHPVSGLLHGSTVGGDQIWTITSGGTETLLGPTGTGWTHDLDFFPHGHHDVVPEPGTYAMGAGIAISALLAFRRRVRRG